LRATFDFSGLSELRDLPRFEQIGHRQVQIPQHAIGAVEGKTAGSLEQIVDMRL
jgi:hypothetical protein